MLHVASSSRLTEKQIRPCKAPVTLFKMWLIKLLSILSSSWTSTSLVFVLIEKISQNHFPRMVPLGEALPTVNTPHPSMMRVGRIPTLIPRKILLSRHYLQKDHVDDPETPPPVQGPSPSSSRSGHSPSVPEFDVSTSQSLPPLPPINDIVSVPQPPAAPTRPSPVPPTDPPSLEPSFARAINQTTSTPCATEKKRHLSLVPPAIPPLQAPLITTSTLVLTTGVSNRLSASEDANLSTPFSSVTPRQSAEDSDGLPQGDYTLRPHGRSIQPLSTAEPVTDRKSGSVGSPMVSTVPVSREIPDFSGSRSFQDLVEQFQREAIMGHPLSVRS
jgi:hypothetical protein